MRRHLLIALLAIVSPLAARANTLYRVTIGPGVLTYTSGQPLTVISFTDPASWLACHGGICNTVQGLVIAQGANLTLVSGNNINGPVIYHGVFTSEDFVKNSDFGPTAYFVSGVTKGSLTEFPHTNPVFGALLLVTVPISQASCKNGTCSIDLRAGNSLILTQTPEPGTIGLLGTGILGLAGLVRKKMLRS